MRNLLAFIGLTVIVVVGVGVWRGWYKFDWKTGSDGNVNINIHADTNKIGDDLKKGGRVVGEKLSQLASDLKNKEEPVPATDFFGVPLKKSDATGLPTPATLPGPR